jgi:uncharacterized protein YjbI with pentapeptide repeats
MKNWGVLMMLGSLMPLLMGITTGKDFHFFTAFMVVIAGFFAYKKGEKTEVKIKSGLNKAVNTVSEITEVKESEDSQYKLMLVAAMIVIFIAIFDMPPVYYDFLRIVVFITIGSTAIYFFNKEDESSTGITLLLITILWNPIIPIYIYEKSVWIILDLIAVGIIAFTLNTKNFENSTQSKQNKTKAKDEGKGKGESFYGEDLSYKDFSYRNLQGAVFFESTLKGANLTGANLKEADLQGVDLSSADLSNADLSGANLTKASLSKSNLTNADMSIANLTKADLDKCNLTNADLIGAVLLEANLFDANFTNANLTEASLVGARVLNTNFTNANLTEADLTRISLNNLDLSGANLSNAIYDNTTKINLCRSSIEELFRNIKKKQINHNDFLKKYSIHIFNFITGFTLSDNGYKNIDEVDNHKMQHITSLVKKEFSDIGISIPDDLSFDSQATSILNQTNKEHAIIIKNILDLNKFGFMVNNYRKKGDDKMANTAINNFINACTNNLSFTGDPIHKNIK